MARGFPIRHVRALCEVRGVFELGRNPNGNIAPAVSQKGGHTFDFGQCPNAFRGLSLCVGSCSPLATSCTHFSQRELSWNSRNTKMMIALKIREGERTHNRFV